MVKFDAETHTYTNENGETLISVTQLLKQAGISPSYDCVNEDILKAAAERGTLIHKEIEDYIKTGELGFTRELHNLIEYIVKQDIKVLASEKQVNNDRVAGTIDLIVEYPCGRKVYADIKTTSAIHTDSVSWQLSIYKDLDKGNEEDSLEVWHFDKEGNLTVKSITEISKEEINRLYDSIASGETYKVQLDETTLAELCQAEKIIAYFENEKKQAEEHAKVVREKIVESMKAKGLTKFENDKILINLIAAGKRETFDSTRFKKEHPDMYDQYIKTSDTKETVRIKLKENNDE